MDNNNLKDERIMEILDNIVRSEFSKKVIDESIEEVKKMNAPSEITALICNAIPMCE